jgi:hypothetical protein
MHTLPTDPSLQAQRIAGSHFENAKQRADQTLENYRNAFSGFSEDELAILDGVMLEPVIPARRPLRRT